MITIGLTGGIGSGKSTVAGIFKELGAYIIDADEISRDVLKKDGSAYAEVVSFFSQDILCRDGEIDRGRLAQLVFSDKAALKALNQITHSRIFEEMRRRLEEAGRIPGCCMAVMDVPLLFAEDFTLPYDKSVAVIADERVRICRAAARDNVSYGSVRARIKNQLPDSVLCERADYVIDNTCNDIEVLTRRVNELYAELRNLKG